jgi:hypothetical protein
VYHGANSVHENLLSARQKAQRRERWAFAFTAQSAQLRSYKKTLPVATPSQSLVENSAVKVKMGLGNNHA